MILAGCCLIPGLLVLIWILWKYLSYRSALMKAAGRLGAPPEATRSWSAFRKWAAGNAAELEAAMARENVRARQRRSGAGGDVDGDVEVMDGAGGDVDGDVEVMDGDVEVMDGDGGGVDGDGEDVDGAGDDPLEGETVVDVSAEEIPAPRRAGDDGSGRRARSSRHRRPSGARPGDRGGDGRARTSRNTSGAAGARKGASGTARTPRSSGRSGGGTPRSSGRSGGGGTGGPAGVPVGVRQQVLARDGYACRRCGRDVNEARLEVRYRVPPGEGGRKVRDNLEAVCRDCL